MMNANANAGVDGAPASKHAMDERAPIVLALNCDGAYAMPLATTLRSMAEANRRHWPVKVHVLVERFPPDLRAKVEGSLPPGAASIHWVDADLSAYRQFSPLAGLTRALPTIAYGRLLMPQVLPQCDRVLYLDVDILVLRDLRPLWMTDLHGASVGAVVDGIDTPRRSGAAPFADVPRVARYFNAGVLLMDLRQWRARGIAESAMRYLQSHRRSPYSDQDGLNVACDGDWHALDPMWNYQTLYHPGSLRDLAPEQRPGIAHFVTGDKPWKTTALSPHASFYDGFRRRTLFARSGPERLADTAARCGARTRRLLRRAPGVEAWLGRRARPSLPALQPLDKEDA